MQDSPEDRLRARFDRMDRENRFFQRVVAFGLFVVAVALTGWSRLDAKANVIEASLGFLLETKEGKQFAGILYSPIGPNLFFTDADENHRIFWTASEDGETHLSLRNKALKTLIELRAPSDELPSLFFYGNDEFRRCWIGEGDEGLMGFGLFDKEGADRLTVYVQGDGLPCLTFLEKDFQIRGDLLLSRDNDMLLRFSDLNPKRTGRLEIALDADGTASLDLLDENRVLLFKAPEP